MTHCKVDWNKPEVQTMGNLLGSLKTDYIASLNNNRDLNKNADGTASKTYESLYLQIGSEPLAKAYRALTFEFDFMHQYGNWIKGEGKGPKFENGEPKPLYYTHNEDGYYVLSEDSSSASRIESVVYLNTDTDVKMGTVAEVKAKGLPIARVGNNYVISDRSMVIQSNLNLRTRTTQAHIIDELFKAGFVDRNVRTLNPYSPVPVRPEMVPDINKYMTKNFQVGTFLIEDKGSFYVNPEALERVNNYYSLDVRAHKTNQSATPYGNAKARLNEEIIKVLTDSGIKIDAINSWAKWYQATFGQAPSGDVLALMAQKTILLAENQDSIAVPKAAAYFIVEALWETPELREVRATYLRNTDQYKRSREEYLAKYRNDELKVDKEVMADLIADIMLQKYVNSTVSGKTINVGRSIWNFIVRALKRFANIFKKNKYDLTTVPNKMKEILGHITEDFRAGKIDLTYKPTENSSPRSRLVSVEGSALAAQMSSAIDRLNREKRLAELIDKKEGLYKSVERAKYYGLIDTWGSEYYRLAHEVIPALKADLEAQTDELTRQHIEAQIQEVEDLLLLNEKNNISEKLRQEIKSINTRINRVRRSIQDNKYEAALYYYLFGGEVYSEERRGAMKVIDGILDIVDQVQSSGKPATVAEYGQIKTVFNYYNKNIADLNILMKNHQWALNELSEKNRDKVTEALESLVTQLGHIEAFITNVNKDQIKQQIKELNVTPDGKQIIPGLLDKNGEYDESLLDDIAAGTLKDVSALMPLGGFAQDLPAETLNLMVKEVFETNNAVGREVFALGQALYGIVNTNAAKLTANKAFMDLAKQMGYKKVFSSPTSFINDILMEVDKDGRSTGYNINEYHLGKFLDRKAEAEEKILQSVEAMLKNRFGIEFQIPRGNSPDAISQRGKILYGDMFFSSEAKVLDPTSGKSSGPLADIGVVRKAIRQLVDRSWENWNYRNTIPLDGWKEIRDQMKKEMSPARYEEWARYNISRSVSSSGQVYEYPKGSLVQPSDGRKIDIIAGDQVIQEDSFDYKNREFEKMYQFEEFREIYDAYHAMREKALNKLPLYHTNSYEIQHRLPQVSQTITDAAFARRGLSDKIRMLKDKFGDIWKAKVDDDLYRVSTGNILDEDEETLDLPPIRWVRMLEDPSVVSQDIISTSLMFYEMAAKHAAHAENATVYRAVMEAFKKRKITTNKALKGFRTSEVDGEESNLYKTFAQFMDKEVAGNSIGKRVYGNVDVSKIIRNIHKMSTDIGLQLSLISATSGFLSGTTEKLYEWILNKAGAVDSVGGELGWAERKAFAAVPSLTWGINNLHSDSLVLNFLRAFQVLESTQEIFEDASKRRAIRAAKNLGYFTFWKQYDYFLKAAPSMAIAHNRRYINGKWYTWQQFKDSGGKKKEWNDNEENSLFNSFEVDVKDGIPEFKIKKDRPWVTQSIIDEVQSLIQITNSRLDSLPTSMDKSGLFYRESLLKLVTLFMGWLFQQTGRSFKRRHFNTITMRYEEGFYMVPYNFLRSTIFEGFGLALPNIAPVSRAVAGKGIGTKLARESLLRIAGTITSMYLVWPFIQFFNRKADDEWDKTWYGEFLAALSTRYFLELVSKSPLFVKEGKDRIVQPTSGTANVLAPIPWAWEALIKGRENGHMISRGAYKGMTKAEQEAIKNLMGVKQWYETFGPRSPQAMESKNTFIKDNVLDTPPFLKPLP